MDLIDKLKYYSDSSQPKQKTSKKSNLENLAEILDGFVLKDNSLPLIKREIKFTYNQLQIDHIWVKELKLQVLSKGDFSKPIQIENLLFFDLETTGLAGGAGTYPFLIGIAYFDRNEFKVVQYFLPEYDRDIYAYIDIKRIVSRKSVLASFNGKSYDYPLLKNRFILNRFDDMFKNFDHLDLLHLSRRMWKNSLDNCSLGNIEQQIFKFNRLNDIDGYLIPNVYFDYLQSGKYDNILNIILHNEQDLVSLARLVYYLSNLEKDLDGAYIENEEIVSLFNAAINSYSLSHSIEYFNLIRKRSVNIPPNLIFKYSILLKKK